MAKWIVLEGYRDGKGRNFNEADILDDTQFNLAEMRNAGLIVCPYLNAADAPIAAFKRQRAQNNPDTSQDLDLESFLQNAGFPTTFTGVLPGGPPSGGAGADLGGTYPNPIVVGLRGFPVSGAAPSSGQALVWTGSQWQPGASGGSLAGDVGGPSSSNTIASIQGVPVVGTGASGTEDLASQFMGWNPSTGTWSAADPGCIRSYGESWWIRERFAGTGTPPSFPYTQSTGLNSVAIAGSVGYDWAEQAIWDTNYRFMHVRIRVRPGTGAVSNQVILFQPDYATIAGWLDSNVANNGGEFTESATIEPYDIVDPAISNGSHIWAKNHIFSAMFEKANNKRRYKRPPATCLVHPSAPQQQNLADGLDAMWTQAFGFNLNSGGPVAWGQTEMNCFWITKSASKMYRIPRWPFGVRAGTNVSIPNAGSRLFSGATDTTSGGATADLYDNVTGPVYGAWDNSTGLFVGTFDLKQWREQFGANMNSGYTCLIGIPINNSADNTQFALLIKPINVDQMFFCGVNLEDKKQTEAVVVRGANLGSANLRVLASDQLGFSMGQRNTHTQPVFMSTLWAAFKGGWRGRSFGHNKKSGDVVFQVRDRNTGRVSLPMTQHLEIKDNVRGVQVAITLEQSRKF